MSVTPDFVGQVYKDTNTGNIWRANSLTPGDWTLEVQNAQIKWNPSSSKWGELSVLSLQNPSPITSIIADVTECGGIDIENQANLTIASFPYLTILDPLGYGVGLKFTSNSALTTLLTPLISSVSSVLLDSNSALVSVNIPELTIVAYGFVIMNESVLNSVDCSLLSSIGDTLVVANNPSLASLSFPSLVSVVTAVSISSNSSLVSLSLPVYVPDNTIDFNASGCALNVASIDGILARHVANLAYVSGTIDLSGGTNAAPSVAGLADKATLEGRSPGVTVIVNP